MPDIGDEEIAEVVNSLKHGWITTGQKSKRFENDFSNFVGGKVESIAVNSATAGLHLVLEALGVGPGDEVIVPDFTFTASAEVIRYLGADPVFVDVKNTDLNIDPELVKEKISPRTKVIMVVHFAGLSVDMDAILSLAHNNNLKVVEDAAHALPSTYNGEMIGTLNSDAAVFSFYATKTITTGEGGMIVTSNPDIAARCRVMRLHGIDRDSFDRYTDNKVSWNYDVIAPGYKYNMTDIAASMGIHQLKKADRFQQRRQEIAGLYNELLAELPLILPMSAPNGDLHSWHLYTVRLAKNAPIIRDELLEALNARGIKCSVHFIPLHRLQYWRETYNLKKEDFPNSEEAFSACLSLPLFTKMTDDQVGRVAKAMTEVLA